MKAVGIRVRLDSKLRAELHGKYCCLFKKPLLAISYCLLPTAYCLLPEMRELTG
jgi:hypothetical protein